MKKEIYIGNTPVTYVLTRKRVKNINLRVKSDGIVYVSANNAVSVDFIENFIVKNGSRILQFIGNVNEKNKDRHENCLYKQGDVAKYLGNIYTVEIIKGEKNKIEIKGNVFLIILKETDNEKLRLKTVEKWYKERIIEIFTKVNNDVAGKYVSFGIPKADLRIRRMVSRWGSCKVTGSSITINSRLIHYPYECIVAVFIHEYAHFIHYYHDKKFYALVERLMPAYRKWDIILKESKWG